MKGTLESSPPPRALHQKNVCLIVFNVEHRDFPHDGCILGRLVRARNVEPPTAVMSRPWRRRREAEQITMTGGQAARRRIAMSPGARFSSSVVFAVLGPCRGLPRSGACEGPDERASAEAERILYFT